MLRKVKQEDTSTKDLVIMILDAIEEENFFRKDVLIPKIKAIITAFRLQLSATNYNKICNPSETAQLIRSDELKNLELGFWKSEFKKLVGEEKMQDYYNEVNEKRILWNTSFEDKVILKNNL